jgi:3'(2'), 5'-bisphosphate nucleotidase
MHASEIERLAEDLLGVALAAARVQMAHFRSGVAVETKADSSPVTVADRQSEEIILAGLTGVAPGVPVISEEAAAAGVIPATGDVYFLVDPLDGTKRFIKGEPQFTINIGLVERGRPVFGLVYAPAIPDFYVTTGPVLAVAARLEPDSQARTLAECGLAPLRTRVPDPNALTALTSHVHLNTATVRLLDSYGVIERTAVSSSLKFGLLARGEADIYARVGETSEWDTAAGQAVLQAAGGSVTTLGGAPLAYGKPGLINPDFVAWGRSPLPRRR